MKKSIIYKFLSIYLTGVLICCYPASAQEQQSSMRVKYQSYYQRFNRIRKTADITANGFDIIEEQIFPLADRRLGEVFFTPALDQQYGRLAVFLTAADGSIIYKTDDLAANYQRRGELSQSNQGLAAVSFQDVNHDQLTDILLISFSGSESPENTYKVGDVLFQNEDTGKQLFYRDYRISDKINQFGMNKSIRFMTSYLVYGYSTEFLYTAAALDELLDRGFQTDTNRGSVCEFEKWGRLQVVPGTYRMAEYYVFMVYLVNEQGDIVWSFQPMRDYESLYGLLGIETTDLDGDGLKDILVLAKYISEETDVESVLSSDYAIYYQRTDGFYEDVDVKREYSEGYGDSMEIIIERARKYWGWG